MNTQVDSPAEIARRTALENAQLHATLREVPFPAGFMRRMREFVEQRIEMSE